MNFRELSRGVLTRRGGFNPSKFPTPEGGWTLKEKTILFTYGKKIDVNSPEFDEELYEILILRTGGRENPIKEFSDYLKTNFGSLPFTDDINSLKFEGSTIGESFPLESDAKKWFDTNAEKLYKNWLDGGDAFIDVLGYFINNRIVINLKSVSDELKTEGFAKGLPTEASNSVKNWWKKNHLGIKKPDTYEVQNFTPRLISGLSESEFNRFMDVVVEIVKKENLDNPISKFFGDTSKSIVSKQEFLSSVLNNESDIFSKYISFASPRRYKSGEDVKEIGRGADYSAINAEFANYFWNNRNDIPQYKGLGEEYTDLPRNEFIEKITADLRGSKNQAITQLFNDYVKSTRAESTLVDNPYIEVIGEILSRAPKLTDYEVNFDGEYDADETLSLGAAFFNMVSLLKLFDVDTNSIELLIEETLESETNSKVIDTEAKRPSPSIQRIMRNLARRNESFSSDLEAAIQSTLRPFRRKVISEIVEMFNSVDLNNPQYKEINNKKVIDVLREYDLVR